MNHSPADKIARAVLYEGYILYPYRPSVKTRQRWTFGGLYPPAFSEIQNGTDPAVMQTQCLAAGDGRTAIEIEVRFLHLMDRRVGRFAQPLEAWPDGEVHAFTEVSSLDVGGKLYQPWQEATERTVRLPQVTLADLSARAVTLEFAMPPSRTLEPIRQAGGGIVGVLERSQQAVRGSVELACCAGDSLSSFGAHCDVSPSPGTPGQGWGEGLFSEARQKGDPHPNPLPEYREREPEGFAAGESRETAGLRAKAALPGPVRENDGVHRITVRISNRTPMDGVAAGDRDAALVRSLVSTHTLLGIEGGRWVSLTDPPAELKPAAEACRNIGAWPILVGEAGVTDTMLSSPIILGDYPQIAPESPGDLFDSTEIDEILTLRIMTLTDEEKRAMASIDERAAALLGRTECLAREQLMALHGTMRTCEPNFTKVHDE